MTSPPGDAGSLLALLRSRGVILSARGTALDYDAPADVLTDELIGAMRRLKPELLARLADEPRPVVRTGPASVGQARQFHLTRRSDKPHTLTVALRFALHGPLDRAALQRALTDLVARHPALRTRYAEHDGEVRQEVLAPRPVPVPVVEVTPEWLDHTITEWAADPFDLAAEPAFRVLLLWIPGPTPEAADRHELALAMHHGIVDGWSTGILVRDLAAFYREAVTGQPADLPAPAADFVDFSLWERRFLADPGTRETVRAWARRNRADATPIVLPTDRPRTTPPSAAGALLTTTVPAELADIVRGYAAHREVTPFVVLAAAFARLVHELTGTGCVSLTVPVANRTDPRFAEVVGVFSHSPWLFVRVGGAASFDELVDRTAAAVGEMLVMQPVPMTVQNEALGGPFTSDPPRVYLAMLDLADPVLRLSGLEPAPGRDVPMPVSRADQTWYLRPLPDGGLSLVLEYATALFDAATVQDWTARYLLLLRRALADPRGWPPAGRESR